MPATAGELSLAYFMGPNYPMNAGYFTPMGDMLAEVSGGDLTVQQFTGGALNQSPPRVGDEIQRAGHRHLGEFFSRFENP